MNINHCSWIIESLLQSVVPASRMLVSILLQLSIIISDLQLRLLQVAGSIFGFSHDCYDMILDLVQVHCCVTMMNWQKVLSL